MAGPEGREQQVGGCAAGELIFAAVPENALRLISHQTNSRAILTVWQSITGHKQTGSHQVREAYGRLCPHEKASASARDPRAKPAGPLLELINTVNSGFPLWSNLSIVIWAVRSYRSKLHRGQR